MILAVIIRSFDPNKGYILSAEEIAKMEGNIATASVIAEQPRRAPAVAMEAH